MALKVYLHPPASAAGANAARAGLALLGTIGSSLAMAVAGGAALLVLSRGRPA